MTRYLCMLRVLYSQDRRQRLVLGDRKHNRWNRRPTLRVEGRSWPVGSDRAEVRLCERLVWACWQRSRQSNLYYQVLWCNDALREHLHRYLGCLRKNHWWEVRFLNGDSWFGWGRGINQQLDRTLSSTLKYTITNHTY